MAYGEPLHGFILHVHALGASGIVSEAHSV